MKLNYEIKVIKLNDFVSRTRKIINKIHKKSLEVLTQFTNAEIVRLDVMIWIRT